jgi:hypothetical protein
MTNEEKYGIAPIRTAYLRGTTAGYPQATLGFEVDAERCDVIEIGHATEP